MFIVVQSALKAGGVLAVTSEDALESGIGRYGFFGARGLRIAEGLSLVLTVPIAVACLIVLIGLAMFRPWAREGRAGRVRARRGLAAHLLAKEVLQDRVVRHLIPAVPGDSLHDR